MGLNNRCLQREDINRESVCVFCGGPARLVSSEEGTSHYESLADERLAAVETERDVARGQVLKVDGWREAATAERDAAQAALTAMTRDRDGYRSAYFGAGQTCGEFKAERDVAQAALGRLHVAANAWLDDYINGDQPSWSDKLTDELCEALTDPTGQAAAERLRKLETLAVIARKHLYDDSNKTWLEFSEALAALDKGKEAKA